MPLILFPIQSQSMSTRGRTVSVYLLTPVVGLMHIPLLNTVFHFVMRTYKGSNLLYFHIILFPKGPTLFKKLF